LARLSAPLPADLEKGLAVLLRAHPDPVTRGLSALALGRFATRSSVRELRDALESGSGIDAVCAAAAFSRIVRETEESEIRTEALDGLRGLVARVKEPEVRATALMFATRWGVDDLAPEVLAGLENPRAGFGRLSLAAGFLGLRDAAPTIRNRLHTRQDRDGVEECALALRMLDDVEVDDTLLGMLSAPGGEHGRTVAAHALGRIRCRTAVDPLAGILGDPREPLTVRGTAALALGFLLAEEPVARRVEDLAGLDPLEVSKFIA
jgi:HEAT repeat protein